MNNENTDPGKPENTAAGGPADAAQDGDELNKLVNEYETKLGEMRNAGFADSLKPMRRTVGGGALENIKCG